MPLHFLQLNFGIADSGTTFVMIGTTTGACTVFVDWFSVIGCATYFTGWDGMVDADLKEIHIIKKSVS